MPGSGRFFYRQLGINTVPVSSVDVAEMAKILENTYRNVNIAFINEMAQICHLYGLNIWEVIDAAATKPFGFQPFYPGLGVGGHCIPKDASFYIHWSRQKGGKALLAEYAAELNAAMPNCALERLKDILTSQGKGLTESKILILGVTYKRDINDLRASPAVKFIELLMAEGAKVSFHDPFITQLNINGVAVNRVNLEDRDNW